MTFPAHLSDEALPQFFVDFFKQICSHISQRYLTDFVLNLGLVVGSGRFIVVKQSLALPARLSDKAVPQFFVVFFKQFCSHISQRYLTDFVLNPGLSLRIYIIFKIQICYLKKQTNKNLNPNGF